MTLLRYGLIIASLSLAACKKKEEPAWLEGKELLIHLNKFYAIR